jgi:hypothetical protein
LDWEYDDMELGVLLVATIEQDFELESMVEDLRKVVVVASSLWVEMNNKIG